MKGTNQIPILKAALVGFVMGVVASGTYVALGGETWLFIPTWALILFYPGFVVGVCSAGLFNNDETGPIAIGCITVGTEYALISVGLFLIGRRVIHFRRNSRTPKVEPDQGQSTTEEP